MMHKMIIDDSAFLFGYIQQYDCLLSDHERKNNQAFDKVIMLDQVMQQNANDIE